MNKDFFVKGVERLVNPVDVGTLHFIQSFNNYIPKKVQKKMVAASGNKTPYMGFVVDPYSYFLCYEISDLEKAKTYLPKGFELAKTKIFDDDEPTYYGIFGCFNAHTSGFFGMRVEFYLIAEDEKTGLLSWIIVDYDTNTITYDPKNGLGNANAPGSLITVDYTGNLHADVVNNKGRKLIYSSDLNKGVMKHLDQRLWVEGNLSVAYGGNKSDDDPETFSLTFNPGEFEKALRMPLDAIQIEVNNWFPGLFESMPKEMVCFPYAQHFLSDSPGHASHITNTDGLINQLSQVDFKKINAFSTEGFKKSFMIGGAVSTVVNLTLIVLFGLLSMGR